MGPTTTTKDWGADEGGEWSNTDTNVRLLNCFMLLKCSFQVNW